MAEMDRETREAFEAAWERIKYDPPSPGLRMTWINGRAIYTDCGDPDDPGSGGNDETGDGSPEKPFRTVARAMEEVG